MCGEGSLPGLYAAFSLYPHMAFPRCSHGQSSGVPSTSYKDTRSTGLGSHPYDLIEALSPNTVTLGVGISTYEFGKDIIQSITQANKGDKMES